MLRIVYLSEFAYVNIYECAPTSKQRQKKILPLFALLSAHSYFDSVESADWISAWICSQIQFLAKTKAKVAMSVK